MMSRDQGWIWGRSRRTRWGVVVGLGLVAGAIPISRDVWAAGGETMVWKLPVERVALKPGNGQAAITGQCAVCHSLDYLTTQPRLTRTAWQATVDKMRSRYQAQLNTNLVPVVVNYLVENYGRENPVPAAK